MKAAYFLITSFGLMILASVLPNDLWFTAPLSPSDTNSPSVIMLVASIFAWMALFASVDEIAKAAADKKK